MKSHRTKGSNIFHDMIKWRDEGAWMKKKSSGMDTDELVMKKPIMQHHPWQMHNNSDYYYCFYET